MMTLTNKRTSLFPTLIQRISDWQDKIHHWLKRYAEARELPLYSSVDIRDAGFKAAIVDTNLYPAGFNNLCEHGIQDAVDFFQKAILARVPACRDILILAEEHTRNTWYLENIRVLKNIIEQSGFQTKIATFLTVEPEFCREASSVELKTATGHAVTIYCLQKLLQEVADKTQHYDLILLNNDLTSGIPQILKDARIPIYPSVMAGWHSRMKSHHFSHAADLIKEFAKIVDMDPWFFSCLYTVVDRVDIHDPQDRGRLRDAAAGLFQRIAEKYQQHRIAEKPYLVIKSDSGTYGMGVLAVEDPDFLVTLNRKDRNKLARTKGARTSGRYLIQEGVPTIYNIDQKVSEVCIYQIEDNLVGGFYRSHPGKGSRENLNSKGMDFKMMCPHSKTYNDCGVHHDVNIFDVYRILARIACVAAHREIALLENQTS